MPTKNLKQTPKEIVTAKIKFGDYGYVETNEEVDEIIEDKTPDNSVSASLIAARSIFKKEEQQQKEHTSSLDTHSPS